MTGYQEILTDPSYARQLVTLTYPHVGNTGCTDQDDEARQVWSSGLIVRDVPRRPSNWRNQQALPEWLAQRGVVAIAGIDTRKLTRILRDRGAQNGALMAGEIDVEKALEAARKFPGLKGMDLAKVVSTATKLCVEGRAAGPGSRRIRSASPRVQGGRLRLRGEAQHPAHAGRARLRRDRGSGADFGGRGSCA